LRCSEQKRQGLLLGRLLQTPLWTILRQALGPWVLGKALLDCLKP
jgi:hypothetical protein